MKIVQVNDVHGNFWVYEFKCPGCNDTHHVDKTWGFNGNHAAPSFSPSILVTGLQTVRDANGEWTGEWIVDANGAPKDLVCHSYVTDGHIEYLGDCTHALAGQKVELPELA